MDHFSSPLRGAKPTSLLLAILLAPILVLCLAGAARARERSLPPSFAKSALLKPLGALARQVAPPADIESILDREAREADEGGDTKRRPQQFAAPEELPLALAEAATWEALPGGGKLGRLRISSPGARSLNLSFSRFELSGDAGLWLYSLDGAQVQGPFRAGDARDGGKLWTPVVLGDEVVVELAVPPGSAAQVELETVNHGFREFGAIPVKQSACNIDVICPEGDPYRDQIRAVGRYTLNGVLVCTGTLLNNTALDRKPYFLSADHCNISAANAPSMVVYWNYQSPTCGALSGGSLADNQAGSTLVAHSRTSDFALVLLDDEPADDFDVFYAGWDATGVTPQKVVAIHHPSLDEKAISIDNDPAVSDDVGSGGQTHWRVRWDEGSTEGGSSGSCIFDQTTKRCVGTLTGGLASCANSFEDYFGKFSRGWLGGGTDASRLSTWLDPIGALGGAVPLALDGLDPDRCVRNDTTACLAPDRFEVRVRWRTAQGQTGFGHRKEIGSSNSVLFWFFDPNNVELLVKVLDGCALNQRFWVFGAASTDVEYTLEVIDRDSGDVTKTYFNTLGTASPAITDSNAFATCSG